MSSSLVDVYNFKKFFDKAVDCFRLLPCGQEEDINVSSEQYNFQIDYCANLAQSPSFGKPFA